MVGNCLETIYRTPKHERYHKGNHQMWDTRMKNREGKWKHTLQLLRWRVGARLAERFVLGTELRVENYFHLSFLEVQCRSASADHFHRTWSREFHRLEVEPLVETVRCNRQNIFNVILRSTRKRPDNSRDGRAEQDKDFVVTTHTNSEWSVLWYHTPFDLFSEQWKVEWSDSGMEMGLTVSPAHFISIQFVVSWPPWRTVTLISYTWKGALVPKAPGTILPWTPRFNSAPRTSALWSNMLLGWQTLSLSNSST